MNKKEEEFFKKQGYLKLNDNNIATHDGLQWIVIKDPKQSKETTGNFATLIKGERYYYRWFKEVLKHLFEELSMDKAMSLESLDLGKAVDMIREIEKKCAASAKRYVDECKDANIKMHTKVCEKCHEEFKVKDRGIEEIEETPIKKKVVDKKKVKKAAPKKKPVSRKTKSAVNK